MGLWDTITSFAQKGADAVDTFAQKGWNEVNTIGKSVSGVAHTVLDNPVVQEALLAFQPELLPALKGGLAMGDKFLDQSTTWKKKYDSVFNGGNVPIQSDAGFITVGGETKPQKPESGGLQKPVPNVPPRYLVPGRGGRAPSRGGMGTPRAPPLRSQRPAEISRGGRRLNTGRK
jgi:hypothetical protein